MASLLRIVLLAWVTLAPAAARGSADGGQAPRVVTVEGVRADQASDAERATLRASLAKYLRLHGFTVPETAKHPRYRLQPSIQQVAVATRDAGVDVEVRASVVALDGRGRVAAMVEGGARARAATPAADPAPLTAQALDAAARQLADDLARRLGGAS